MIISILLAYLQAYINGVQPSLSLKFTFAPELNKLKQDFDWVKDKTKEVYDKVKPLLTPKEKASAIENAGTFDAINVTNFGAKSGSWRDAFRMCYSLRNLYIKNLSAQAPIFFINNLLVCY